MCFIPEPAGTRKKSKLVYAGSGIYILMSAAVFHGLWAAHQENTSSFLSFIPFLDRRFFHEKPLVDQENERMSGKKSAVPQ